MLKNVTIAGKAGLGWFPSNYDPARAYPCIAFIGGKGEVAMPGTTGLLVHGPFKYFTSTTAGPDIILIGIVPGNPAGCTPQECAGFIKDIAAQFKVTKIYPSGLSLGAQNWMNMIFQPGADLSLIGGVILFSTDTPNVAPYGTDVIDYSIFKKNNLFSYGGCGTADPFYNSLPNNMVLVYNGVKAQNLTIPLLPELDTWTGLGHDAKVWDDGYNPLWKSPAMGVDIYTKVMQLSPAQAAPLPAPAPTPSPAPAPNPAPSPAPVPAKTITKVTVTMATSYSDGSTSTNTQTLQ